MFKMIESEGSRSFFQHLNSVLDVYSFHSGHTAISMRAVFATPALCDYYDFIVNHEHVFGGEFAPAGIKVLDKEIAILERSGTINIYDPRQINLLRAVAAFYKRSVAASDPERFDVTFSAKDAPVSVTLTYSDADGGKHALVIRPQDYHGLFLALHRHYGTPDTDADLSRLAGDADRLMTALRA